MSTHVSYNEPFFRDQQINSLNSARSVVPMVLEFIPAASVVDVGCGVGSWLAAFSECGVDKIIGIDGDYVDPELLQIPTSSFVSRDLGTAIGLDQLFDLAVSLEVAEHLPEQRAQSFVAELCALAPVILFSAAVVRQGGVDHLNEQWQSYWAALFEEQGYVCLDIFRPRLWTAENVRWWYAQNMLLYVKRDSLANYPALANEIGRPVQFPLDVVHPKMYLGLEYATDPANMKLAKGFSVFCLTVSQFVRRRLQRKP